MIDDIRDFDGFDSLPKSKLKTIAGESENEAFGTAVAYTQEQLLAGSNYSSMEYTGNQKTEKFDYFGTVDDISKFIHFGSAYAYVSNAINEINSTYPLGAMVGSALTISCGATGTLLALTSSTISQCTGRETIFSNIDYSKYVFSLNISDASEFEFTASPTTSDTNNFVMYTLLDNWGLYNEYTANSSNPSITIYPTDLVYAEYLAQRTKYAQLLLDPNKADAWPRDELGKNINSLSTGYATFITNELLVASDLDNMSANTLWSAYIPFGIQNGDSSESSLYKMLLTYGHSFDIVKSYIDGISNLHTAAYSDDESVTRQTIGRLAELWGWSLTNKLSLKEFKDSILKTSSWVATDSTISLDDFSYMMWKRVLANLIAIYKAKGTKEAISMLLAIYGIPSELLDVELQISRVDGSGEKITDTTDSGVFVRNVTGNTITFYNKDGTSYTVDGRRVQNDKTISAAISVECAIENDVLEYYNDTYTTDYRLQELENLFMNLYCPSDGTAQYLDEYVGLNEIYAEYLTASANKLTRALLQPFVDFLEISMDDIVDRLLPASCKISGLGTVVRNSIFDRSKHRWVDYSTPVQPFNSGVTFSVYQPVITQARSASVVIPPMDVSSLVNSKVAANISAVTQSAKVGTLNSVSIDNMTESAFYMGRYSSLIHLNELSATTLNPYAGDDIAITADLSNSTAFGIDLPTLTCMSPYSGTTNFTTFDSAGIFVSKDGKHQISMIVDNLSRSGNSEVEINLYRVLAQDERDSISNRKYQLSKIVSEVDQSGVYEFSVVTGLTSGDFLKLESSLSYFYASEVKITDIDYVSHRVTTFPKFGLCYIPIGSNGELLNIRTVVDYEFIKDIIRMYNDGVSLDGVKKQSEYIEYIAGVKTSGWARIVDNIIKLVYTLMGQSVDVSSIEQIELAYLSSISPIVIRKNPYTFDWASPVQTIISNQQDWGGFSHWDSDVTSAYTWNTGLTNYLSAATTYEATNTLSISGSVEFGGLNELNANILTDKGEYFWTSKITTPVPLEYSGHSEILGTYSGLTCCVLDPTFNDVNNIRYYGLYFTYMTKPKSPLLVEYPFYESTTGNTMTIPVADTASVYITFKGVSDASRLDVDFISAPISTYVTASSISTIDGYSSITAQNWADSSTTIDIRSKSNANDNTVYTVQTTLDPNSYYWYRVKNYKSTDNMFGLNLSVFNTTEPKMFKTGTFTDEVRVEGEIEQEASAPSPSEYRVEINPES